MWVGCPSLIQRTDEGHIANWLNFIGTKLSLPGERERDLTEMADVEIGLAWKGMKLKSCPSLYEGVLWVKLEWEGVEQLLEHQNDTLAHSAAF